MESDAAVSGELASDGKVRNKRKKSAYTVHESADRMAIWLKN